MGSELSTTNNRMELRAVIESLRGIPKESKLAIFTDSKYVINGIESWIMKWKKNNWMGSNKKLVKNKDLWLDLDGLTKSLSIKWNWVKGHSGNIENEEVDKLAKQEAKKLIIDHEGKIPRTYFNEFLDFLNISEEYFIKIRNKFTNPVLFKKDNNQELMMDNNGELILEDDWLNSFN